MSDVQLRWSADGRVMPDRYNVADGPTLCDRAGDSCGGRHWYSEGCRGRDCRDAERDAGRRRPRIVRVAPAPPEHHGCDDCGGEWDSLRGYVNHSCGVRFDVGAVNRAKTHCDHGHELAPANTYTHPDGRRRCRACDRDRKAGRR